MKKTLQPLQKFYDNYHQQNRKFHKIIGENNFTYYYVQKLIKQAINILTKDVQLKSQFAKISQANTQIDQKFQINQKSIKTFQNPRSKNNERTQLKILDVGCGVGAICFYLAKQGYDVTGIDISKRAIKIAKNAQKYFDQKLTLQNKSKFKLKFIQGNIETLWKEKLQKKKQASSHHKEKNQALRIKPSTCAASDRLAKSSNQSTQAANKKSIEDSNQNKNSKLDAINTKYDLILATEIIEHLKDDLKFLKQIKKILKPNGILILTTPSPENFLYKIGYFKKFDQQVGHLRRYSKQILTTLIKQSSLTIMQIRKREGPLRSILFTSKLGFVIRFIKGPLIPLFHKIDELLNLFFGASDWQVIAEKKET